MRVSRIYAMAWENMKQRRVRTTLTTLSVVIGITAIISLASLGEGFRLDVRERMQSGFELDNLTVIPGSLFAGLSLDRFTDEKVQEISNVTGVKRAVGVMQLGNVTLYNGNKEPVQAFVATAVNFTEFIQIFPDRFVFENEAPWQYTNDTIIIGYKVNHPNENITEPFAVANDTIDLTFGIPQKTPFPHMEYQNQTFIVGGTLQKRGTPGITNFDYWIFIPLETARTIFDSSEYDLVFAKVYNSEDSEKIAKDIEALFPPFKITILVPLTFIKQVDNILTIIQVFLMAIASISLLVAGIGIMNIMTVSVMERTREIGILKAIVTKSRTILSIFLAEAVLVGLIGGFIGIFTGYGLSFGLAQVLSSFIQPQQGSVLQNPERQNMTISPVFSLQWTAIAFVFAVVVCIIFGMYPARKASKLNPVEALRYE